jgi:signal transduction histidine kinase
LQETATAARLYIDIGDLWWVLRRYDRTRYYFKKSEKIAQQLNDTAALIAVYGNLGNLHYSLGDLKTSDVYMQRALKLAEQKKAIRAQQQLLANMGASLQQTGHPEAAIPYFEKAISLADDRHAHQHNLQSYYNLAFAWYEAGNYHKAKESVQNVIRMSEALDMDKEHLGEAMLVMAKIYEQEHDYKAADLWLNKHIAYVEDMLQKQADSSIGRLEDNYRIAEKDKELAQAQLLLYRKELMVKNRNTWIAGISAGLLLLGLGLLIVIRTGRHKRRLSQMEIGNLKQEKELGYLKAMIAGEEKERTRLARELHDGIGGMLAAAKMGLGAIKNADDTAALANMMRLLSDTATEVRQTAHNLMPDILTRNSLKDALLLYCADINLHSGLEIDLQFYGGPEAMNKSAELILYRIAQELVQNIVKHAHATEAVMQIIQDGSRLNLIVEDNGIGFEQQEVDKGFGLQNLQFRVQALQGYISITSAKGKGTSVYIEFDLEKLKNV